MSVHTGEKRYMCHKTFSQSRDLNESTRERSRTNVTCVASHLICAVLCTVTWESTRERSHTSVHCVTKHSHTKVTCIIINVICITTTNLTVESCNSDYVFIPVGNLWYLLSFPFEVQFTGIWGINPFVPLGYAPANLYHLTSDSSTPCCPTT